MPAFSFRHVKELYSGFWTKSAEFVEVLAKSIELSPENTAETAVREDMNRKYYGDQLESSECLQEETLPRSGAMLVDMATWTNRMTLDIIGLAAMGYNFNTIENPDSEIVKQYGRALEPNPILIVIVVLSKIFPEWLIKLIPIKANQQIDEAKEAIRNVCKQVIALKSEKGENKQLSDFSVLDVALESGAFDDENLISQLLTFLAAG